MYSQSEFASNILNGNYDHDIIISSIVDMDCHIDRYKKLKQELCAHMIEPTNCHGLLDKCKKETFQYLINEFISHVKSDVDNNSMILIFDMSEVYKNDVEEDPHRFVANYLFGPDGDNYDEKLIIENDLWCCCCKDRPDRLIFIVGVNIIAHYNITCELKNKDDMPIVTRKELLLMKN